jgi:hypothetical protein
MLNNLSEQIRDCLQHAEDCARKAAAQPDGSKLRQDFLTMEQHWLSQARSFQLGERSTISLMKASAPITPFLRGQAFDPETVEAMATAFVTTCAALGLSNRDDAMTKLVAKTIIELAQRGIRNPTALHMTTIKEFKCDPQQLVRTSPLSVSNKTNHQGCTA